MSEVLLLVLSIPGTNEGGLDADEAADQLVDAINEDRRYRHTGPEPYEPVMVSILPVPPQWLNARAQQMLLKAIQIVNFGHAPDTKASESES